MLCLTLKDDTNYNERTENKRQKANASAKSKELQANSQANAFAAHLLLPHAPIIHKLNLTIK